MTSTVFVDGQTVIQASWLNDVNNLVYSGGSSGIAWGAITGTLSNQTDLQVALNSKAPATSGSSILYGNGSGGFSPVTIGANLTFSAGILAATGGGGMTYPGAGIPVSTGSAWGTSLTAPSSGTVLASITAPASNPVTGTPTASNYLRGDGTWATPSGGGNVSGPGSSTNGYVVTWNGTTGTTLATGLAAPATGTLITSTTALSGAVTGTPSASNYLRGDGTWATPSGGGTVTSGGTSTIGFVPTWNNTAGTLLAAGLAAPASGTLISSTTALAGAITGTPSSTTFLRGDGTWSTPSGSGDMILASAQTVTGAKTFLASALLMRNVANTFSSYFVNTNTATRTYTLKDADGTIAFTSDIPNLAAPGPIGGTTPSTGAFTTVVATGGVDKLTSATGAVSVAAATAPTIGQVLTATSATVATWQTPSAGGSAFPAGTQMLFVQTAAPTGWTKVVTTNDATLRVVSGAAGTGGTTAFSTVFASRTPAGSVSGTASGTSAAATATNVSYTPTGNVSISGGSVDSHSLSIAELPAHDHITAFYSPGGSTTGWVVPASSTGASVSSTQATGSTLGHTHPFTPPGGSFTGNAATITQNSHSHTISSIAISASFSGTAMDFAVKYVDVIMATKD